MGWISPFSLPGHWFKGNLHTHTSQSDGRATPDEAIAWYRQRGYDFIAVTDHWVLTPGQRLPSGDFVTLTGAELDGPGYHLLALGLSRLPAESVPRTAQAIVDAVREAGGLCFFAHPYWTNQPSTEIAPVQGVVGLEIYNGVCEEEVGRGYSCVHWDELLCRGHRFWGVAVDDTHWHGPEQGRGFIMVRAASLDERSILDALRQGYFYASTGPVLHDLQVVHRDEGGPLLRVRCSPCQHIIIYTSSYLGRRFTAENGALLDGAVYPLRREYDFVRVECRDAAGRSAWSNPIFMEDVLKPS